MKEEESLIVRGSAPDEFADICLIDLPAIKRALTRAGIKVLINTLLTIHVVAFKENLFVSDVANPTEHLTLKRLQLQLKEVDVIWGVNCTHDRHRLAQLSVLFLLQ